MGYAFRAMWLIFCVFVRCTVLIIIIITKFLKLAQKEYKIQGMRRQTNYSIKTDRFRQISENFMWSELETETNLN